MLTNFLGWKIVRGMNEVAQLIQRHRGGRKVTHICRAARISRQSWKEIHDTGRVKLVTLKKIAGALKLKKKKWHWLVRAWTRVQLGKKLSRQFDIRILPF